MEELLQFVQGCPGCDDDVGLGRLASELDGILHHFVILPNSSSVSLRPDIILGDGRVEVGELHTGFAWPASHFALRPGTSTYPRGLRLRSSTLFKIYHFEYMI